MLQNKQTRISCSHIFPIIIILSFGIFLTACSNSRTSMLPSTETAILPATSRSATGTQTENSIPTPVPAKNGWISEYTATISDTSVNQFTQMEIAEILFAQWLSHFKTEDADSQSRLDEYELLKVEIPENLAFLAQEKTVDFIATVVFSVKPNVYLYSNWNAGNGVSTDNIWIRNKFLIVGIDKENEMYSLLIIGTGP